MSYTNKNFLITLNLAVLEFYEDIKQYVIGRIGFRYLLCCEHVGDPVNNKHYHMYVQYDKTTYLSYRHLHGAHLDQCRGSAQANIKNCKAEDDKHKKAGITAILIDEIGEPKYKDGDWSVKAIKELDSPDELPAIHYNTYKKINRDSTIVRAKDFRKSVKVYWIQGPSDIYKS